MNQLQVLVLSRLHALGERGKPLPYREAARRSRGAFSHETLASIVSGRHGGGLTDRIAAGLAEVLEVDLDQVYAAAGVPRPLSRWHLPDRFDRLNHAQRKLIEEMASALLKAYDDGRRDS